MILFAINAGSSSLKLKIFELDNFYNSKALLESEAKLRDGICTLSVNGDEANFDSWDHRLEAILKHIARRGMKIQDASAIIHRVVHGLGEERSIIQLDQEYLERLNKTSHQIAPLHNPQALEIIKKIQEITKKLSNQYICFDTSFGMTISELNHVYALPREIREKYPVRKYLFHGLSHKYVMNKYYDTHEGQKSKNIISLHLGSGSSICAINGVQAVDSSFGFTPLENLVSSTRIGEFDIDAYNYIKYAEDFSDKEMVELLNKKSGLLGLSGFSSDMKVLIDNYNTDNNCRFAIDVYIATVVKYVYQAMASLGKLDVLIFTGGIGQSAPFIREAICNGLELLGIVLDKDLNAGKDSKQDIFKISQDVSNVDTFVVKTNEEKQMINELLLSQYIDK